MKTFGSKDKVKRKTRADKGKVRKLYRGKKVKKKRRRGGKLKPYIPRRTRDGPIKLYLWKEDKMSIEGHKNFSRKTRSLMKPVVFGRGSGRFRLDVDPYQISNKEILEETLSEFLTEGNWMVMGFSNAKTKTGTKPVKMFRVRVKDTKTGLKVTLTNNYRLFRYFFWSGN